MVTDDALHKAPSERRDLVLFSLDQQPQTSVRISVGNNYIAVLDREDYTGMFLACVREEKIVVCPATVRWQVIARRTNRYCYTKVKGSKVLLHRLILGATTGTMIDHINHNGLDNRRCNLRLANHSQNGMNRPGNKPGYKGVRYRPRYGTFYADIRVNRRTIHLGTFKTATDAAQAYNNAAMKYFGEFAWLNPLPAAACERA